MPNKFCDYSKIYQIRSSLNITSPKMLTRIMDFTGFIYTGIGGGVGYLVNTIINLWKDAIQRRRSLGEHIMKEIEKNAETYYLLENYAYILSSELNSYIVLKRQIQYRQADSGSYSNYLKERGTETTKSALFYAGKLYRTMYDHFWIKGAKYFLPDKWADNAIENLHDEIMNYLHFDTSVLLKYIKTETEDHMFFELLKDSESNDALKDLREQFSTYWQWLSTNDKEVMYLAAYAQSYSDLFRQQMYRLYKEWYKRGLWRGEAQEDPLKAQNTSSFSALNDITRELITRSSEKRHSEESRSIVKEIIDKDAMEFNAHLNMGWNYYDKGRYDVAIKEYEEARIRKPENAMIYNNLGNVYTSKGEFHKAIQMYKRSLDIEKNPMVYNNFGLMWKNKRDYKEAVQCFKNAIELDPLTAEYQNQLGILYTDNDHGDEAIECYSKAISLAPSDHVLYDNLASVYVRQADQREDKANKLDKDREKDKKNKLEEAVRSNRGVAIKIYELAIDLADENTKILYYYRKGELHARLEEWNNASDSYEQAFERDKDNADYAFRSGKNALYSRMYEKAITAFDSAIKLSPDEMTYYFGRGLAYYDMQNYEKALNEFEAASKLDTKSAPILFNIGNCYYQMQRLEMAKEKWEEATKNWEEDTEIKPSLAKTYYNLGVLHYKQGNKESARLNWEKSVVYDKELLSAHYNLGIVYFEQEHKDEAMQHFQKFLENVHSRLRRSQISKAIQAIQRNESPNLIVRDIITLTISDLENSIFVF